MSKVTLVSSLGYLERCLYKLLVEELRELEVAGETREVSKSELAAAAQRSAEFARESLMSALDVCNSMGDIYMAEFFKWYTTHLEDAAGASTSSEDLWLSFDDYLVAQGIASCTVNKFGRMMSGYTGYQRMRRRGKWYYNAKLKSPVYDLDDNP